jgi:polyisoprenoid-binding protein YceI
MSTIEQQQTEVPAGTYTADTVHSSVGFEVPYAVATFRGSVPEFEASLVDGRLEGSAKIASLQTKEENLQAHLLSPEFFDA